MHSAMMMRGDPPTCCYAAAERKSIQVEFRVLNTNTFTAQKVAIFAEKNSKSASDVRKTLKYSHGAEI